MAGGDASLVPAALDPNFLMRELESIRQWQREFPSSVAQTVTQIVAERTLNTQVVVSGLAGFAPPFPQVTPSWDGADTAATLPANAVNISVTGEFQWTHNLPATAGGTLSGYVEYRRPTTGTLGGSVRQTVTGLITNAKVNDLRFPFAFSCASPAELAKYQLLLTFTIATATFNGADVDSCGGRTTITYGLA